jgi:hypothetical protein
MQNPLAGRYDDLAVGLAFGAAAALLCLAIWAWRRDREVPAPVVGLAFAAAGAAGIAATHVPTALALRPPWIVVLAGVAGALLADFDRRWRRQGLVVPLLAVTAAGIYLTVPDVEAAVVVLGAALPPVLLGWPVPFWRAHPPPSLGLLGALATAGLLVWTVASGGAARPGSVVGGVGCLGVLAVEPLARLVDRRHRGPLPAERAAWIAFGAQLLLVGVAARVVGRADTVAGALPPAALALAGALAVALIASARIQRRAASDTTT